MSDRFSGFAFPFRIVDGAVARASGFEKIEQDVRHLLSTRLGERVMRRDYGGGVHHRLQEPNASTLHALIRHEIQEALRLHMPDVRLTAPIRVNGEGEVLLILVEYTAGPRDIVRRLELRI